MTSVRLRLLLQPLLMIVVMTVTMMAGETDAAAFGRRPIDNLSGREPFESIDTSPDPYAFETTTCVFSRTSLSDDRVPAIEPSVKKINEMSTRSQCGSGQPSRGQHALM